MNLENKKIFPVASFLVIFISIMNFIANKFYWYYSIWYFDMIMHFLGGLWVTLFCIFLFKYEDFSSRYVFKIFLFTLLVVFGWELFEFVFNNKIGGIYFDIFDTTSDILFGIAGCIVAFVYFYKKIVLKNKDNV